MGDYGLAPDSLNPTPHYAHISQKFSSVVGKGGSSNGEIYRSSNVDEITSTNYFKGLKEGYGAYKHNGVDHVCSSKDRVYNDIKCTPPSKFRSGIPRPSEGTSRAVLQPKGLHTHVLNCSGLRPNRSRNIGHPLNGVFEHVITHNNILSDDHVCTANSLSIRDKVDKYPHVCGKDNIVTAPQPAESSTSSDQDLPITRVHHYKKKMHKNPRLKTNRRLRTCSNRNCADKWCGNFARDSEDSSIFSKSDSESKYSSTNSRVPKVSISTSTEILYEESGSFKFIPPSSENDVRPLKSALKISQPHYDKQYNESESPRKSRNNFRFARHTDDNYRKSFVLNNHEHNRQSRKPPSMFSNPRQQHHQLLYNNYKNGNIDDTDVYDPSLPVIPIMISAPKSNSGSVDSQRTKSISSKSVSSVANSRKSGSIASSIRSGSTDLEDGIRTIRRNKTHLFKNFNGKTLSKSMSNLTVLQSEPTSDLASETLSDSMEDLTMVSPTLGNWHEALAMTKMLGWTLILYHAVRNNYKPLQFARQLLKVCKSVDSLI